MVTCLEPRETKVKHQFKIGDRVYWMYLMDGNFKEYAYGTLHGFVDDTTATIKIVLKGKRKDIIDYEDVEIDRLMLHIPDSSRKMDEEKL
ncbi:MULTISPECIES: hypothetical protein [unclassified Exiguobacterium]|uniref:hypothetical protein n=1 Tax=unclassified Exiguobacterium TaxID=2644629 RepID=UPI001BE5960B|nr:MULTISPECIES: hypothetical protein [unclassified Exiguobacterium]